MRSPRTLARIVGLIPLVVSVIAMYGQYSFNHGIDNGFFDALTSKNMIFAWAVVPCAGVLAVLGLFYGIYAWVRGDMWPFIINTAAVALYIALFITITT